MYKILKVKDASLVENKNKRLENFFNELKELELDNRGSKINLSDGDYFLKANGHEIVGYARVNYRNGFFIISEIFVKEKYRYLAHGMKLLRYIEKVAKAKNSKGVLVRSKETTKSFFLNYSYRQGPKGNLYLRDFQKSNERKSKGLIGTYVSLVVNIILAILKVFFGILGNSRALISDGFHSFSDVITSFVVLISVYYGARGEDDEHPYGHEKIEAIASNMVGVILIITAFELIKDNIYLIKNSGETIRPSFFTVYIAGFSMFVKYLLYLYKIRIGKKINNTAIIADAKEHLSDAYSSLGVVAGILLSIGVAGVFDPVFGLVVGGIIFKEGVVIIKDAISLALDEQDPNFIKEVEDYVNENTEIKNIHETLMRVSGDNIYLSFHIRLPEDMSIAMAHDISSDLENKLLEHFEELKKVIIHIDCLKT